MTNAKNQNPRFLVRQNLDFPNCNFAVYDQFEIVHYQKHSVISKNASLLHQNKKLTQLDIYENCTVS